MSTSVKINQRRELSFSAMLRVIARWPLLFLAPIVIVTVSVLAYAARVSLYQAEGIVIFDLEFMLPEGVSIDEQIESKKFEAVSSLLYGDPIREIVSGAWPQISEKSNPLAFNDKVSHLRSRSGLRLQFQRDNARALAISYVSSDPGQAFRVVDSTIQTLVALNRSGSQTKITSNIDFLRKEREASQRTIQELQSKLTRLKNGLPPAVVEAHQREAQMYLQSDSSTIPPLLNDEGSVGDRGRLNSGSYQDFKLELAIARKEAERLEDQLRTKAYINQSDDIEALVDVDQDPVIAVTMKTIVEKQQKLSQLLATGYRDRHPDVRGVRSEIESLNEAKLRRLKELKLSKGTEALEVTELKLERRVREKLEVKREEIAELEDRIAVMEEFKKDLASSGKELDQKIDMLSLQRAMLFRLESDLQIARKSYENLTTELDLTERRKRVEDDDIGVRVTVAEPPRMPQASIPMAHLSTILMSLVITIAGCLGLACGWSLFDTRVYTTDDLARLVSIPVLGGVDRIVERQEIVQGKKFSVAVLTGLVIFSAVVFVGFIL